MQALGLFGGRDFDKNVFAIPIPVFDSGDDLHRRIAELAAKAEELADTVLVDPLWSFQKARKVVREALLAGGLSAQIETAVRELIPPIEIKDAVDLDGAGAQELVTAD